MPETPTARSRLSIRSASKTFGRTTVLSSVDLDVRAGEIHGLVGQNGSGKSTLIKLLSGFYPPDEGASFSIDGAQLSLPIRPSELQNAGLAFVHQDLGLVADATVVENVKIGRYSVHPVTRRIRWKSDAEDVAAVLATLGSGGVDPFALVSSLTHGERASVAIARAILGTSDGEGCVVFDESTQSLPREILHEFYTQIRRLAASGTAVVIVSHRLDEILALCDRVTVLEDGKVTVKGLSTTGLNEPELTRLILGGSLKARAARDDHAGSTRPVADRKVAIQAFSVAGGAVKDASFSVHAGEIVGVIGNSESGFDELPYLIAGTRKGGSGSIAIGGTVVDTARFSPSRAIALGLCFVPGKRAEEGLALDLVALENVSLPRVARRRFFLSGRWQKDEFAASAGRLGVTPALPGLPAGAFSGGNQQKLLMSKWLLNAPKVLVLHEPTQAVDVGARTDILDTLRAEARSGTAILVCSLETDDLAALCDRVLVMRDGMVKRELSGDQLTAHSIIDAAYGEVDAGLERTRA